MLWGKIDTYRKDMNDRPLSSLNEGTSEKNGEVKLVFWTNSTPSSGTMMSFKCITYVSKMSTFTYSFVISLIKNICNLYFILVIDVNKLVKITCWWTCVIGQCYNQTCHNDDSIQHYVIQIVSDFDSIQHDVIKFVSGLWQIGGFLWVLLFPPLIKLTAMI
jgi:hypothetical protein